MKYIKAGKFIKEKRKRFGFITQKAFINALQYADSDISCSESYISLIEAGEKVPSVHLLDVMATVLKLSPQEKGELLLIYKRVPEDLTFAVRDNLKKSLKITAVDILRKRYNKSKNKTDFNNLIRALVMEGETEEALNLLKTPPEPGANFIDYQDRTAKMALIAGNYDFAICAFKLAIQTCSDEFIQSKADLLMNIGICYFAKALKLEYEKPYDSFEFLLYANQYLANSLEIITDNIYCLDEYARCLYHIGDTLDYFYKTFMSTNATKENINSPFNKWGLGGFSEVKVELNNYPAISEWLKDKDFSNSFIIKSKDEHFQKALEIYKKILSHSEKGDLPEKALKEAVYFHAYIHCKLGLFDDALVLINSIIILDRNWLTFFLKAGYALMKYEKENKKELIEQSLENIRIAMEYDPDTVKSLIKKEKEREFRILWDLKKQELITLLEDAKNV